MLNTVLLTATPAVESAAQPATTACIQPATAACIQPATAACLPSGQGAVPTAAAAARQPRPGSLMIFARPRVSWDAGQHVARRIAADPSMTGPGDLGNPALLAGPRGAYVQSNSGKQFPYLTRFAAASGDAQGPHPARDPV